MARAILITGGSRGFGLSFAEALLGAGYSVAITAARDQVALDATATDLASKYRAARVLGLVADAGVAAEADRTVTEVLDRFGRVDILINNAGRGTIEINLSFHREVFPFWEIDPVAWSGIIQTNVTGPFLMARAVAPHMVKSG
ncbi:MAG: SDR family oxidoreductase [Rhodobacteraceae bacterium]|nr:SDR family oxidoreductase [Paracoccaceae bacterium]